MAGTFEDSYNILSYDIRESPKVKGCDVIQW